MCFGDLQKNTVIVGITAIVCSIIFLILGFPNDDLRHYLSYDVAPIGHTITIFVMWILIGLAAAALLVGAFFENRYIVLAWLVVAFVCGVVLIVFYIILVTEAHTDYFVIISSVRLSLNIVLFVIWIWVPLVYFLSLSGYTPFCRKSES
ncbi:uncharacterized protein LOC108161661 isoform X1 [Drosophila miranda]|uniref:uncharacterized protein LOC108161661 isoform X1 n=1 Tax=Drosophila miranda TaxID=7229 RepID=UPI00143F7B37|nr:uncharacterized protein LOC108161661 isoform X1 [Drosophila miranda]